MVQPKALTSVIPNIVICAFEHVKKKYTRNINGALPVPRAIKACAQPVDSTTQHPGGPMSAEMRGFTPNTVCLFTYVVLFSFLSFTAAVSFDLTELRNKVAKIKVNPRGNLWATGKNNCQVCLDL